MTYESAPRMWRCFLLHFGLVEGDFICSTHVEMFPRRSSFGTPKGNLLHACGDVSHLYWLTLEPSPSAPRMWRCFRRSEGRCGHVAICSTHVEMFPTFSASPSRWRHLLHACGDVSPRQGQCEDELESAPRMWRCFHVQREGDKGQIICSTHVEMFLASRSARS